MIDALNLSACLASALTGAAASGVLAMAYGLRLGWRRGIDTGWSDALAICASSKSIQDRQEVFADPRPGVGGQGCRPSAEVHSTNDVAVANIVPVAPEVAPSVLHLHQNASRLRDHS